MKDWSRAEAGEVHGSGLGDDGKVLDFILLGVQVTGRQPGRGRLCSRCLHTRNPGSRGATATAT